MFQSKGVPNKFYAIFSLKFLPTIGIWVLASYKNFLLNLLKVQQRCLFIRDDFVPLTECSFNMMPEPCLLDLPLGKSTFL